MNGICECGCGGKTGIVTKNHTNPLLIKGEFRRFISGHQNRIYHKNKMFSSLQERQICNEYLQGGSSHDLAIIWKCADTTILKVLKRNHIKRRTNSQAHLGLQIGAKNGMFGKTLSQEYRDKISRSAMGRKGPTFSKETIQRLSEQKSGGKNPNFGKHPSSETRKKLSESQIMLGRKGNKCPNWKGGLTPLNTAIRTCIKYDIWRSTVFIRDSFTCRRCGKKTGNGKAVYLNVHHIKSLSSIIRKYHIKTLEQAFTCEELWDINNGITLCEECHNKTKGRPKWNP